MQSLSSYCNRSYSSLQFWPKRLHACAAKKKTKFLFVKIVSLKLETNHKFLNYAN